jgi:hypothetical protein
MEMSLAAIKEQLATAEARAEDAKEHARAERENIKAYLKKKFAKMANTLQAYERHMIANGLALPKVAKHMPANVQVLPCMFAVEQHLLPQVGSRRFPLNSCGHFVS